MTNQDRNQLTPAVQRVTEQINATLGDDEPASPAYARSLLAAALDVEEMARAIHESDQGPDVWDMEGEKFKDVYRTNARAVRASILGGDS